MIAQGTFSAVLEELTVEATEVVVNSLGDPDIGAGSCGGPYKGGTRHMSLVVDWASAAACQSGDPDALFVQGAEQNVAKRVCRTCPVRYECLADALDNKIEFGVWGGMTERERRALLRRHPQVTNWRRLFETALKEKEFANI